MLNLLKKAFQEEGLTIISIFHDLNLASIASDRLILLNEGRIEQIGTPQEVLNSENLPRGIWSKTNINKPPSSSSSPGNNVNYPIFPELFSLNKRQDKGISDCVKINDPLVFVTNQGKCDVSPFFTLLYYKT